MGKTKRLNRLKVVLAERQRTNKWLAEKLDKDPSTVSKWCTNRAQPGLETLYQIASYLDVDVKALLVPNKGEQYVVTNFPSAILRAGYVYAFLASKYGKKLIQRLSLAL